jgi:hypothetical protein
MTFIHALLSGSVSRPSLRDEDGRFSIGGTLVAIVVLAVIAVVALIEWIVPNH